MKQTKQKCEKCETTTKKMRCLFCGEEVKKKDHRGFYVYEADGTLSKDMVMAR